MRKQIEALDEHEVYEKRGMEELTREGEKRNGI